MFDDTQIVMFNVTRFLLIQTGLKEIKVTDVDCSSVGHSLVQVVLDGIQEV